MEILVQTVYGIWSNNIYWLVYIPLGIFLGLLKGRLSWATHLKIPFASDYGCFFVLSG